MAVEGALVVGASVAPPSELRQPEVGDNVAGVPRLDGELTRQGFSLVEPLLTEGEWVCAVCGSKVGIRHCNPFVSPSTKAVP